MLALFGLIAVAAGVLNTVQSGANVTLGKALDAPIVAAMVVTGVNLLVYLAVGAVIGFRLPGLSRLADVPWWAWLGGPLGAAFVFGGAALTPKLGAAAFIAAVVGGQLGCALLLDHFGLMHVAQRDLSVARLVGAAMVFGGVLLVTYRS